MPRQFYFGQVEYPIDTNSVVGRCYRDPTPDQIRLFRTVNGFDGPASMLHPGRTLVVPGLGTGPDDDIAFASLVRAQVGHAADNSHRKPEPRLFNQNFGTYLYAQMQSAPGSTGFAVDALNVFQGQSASFIDETLKEIARDLHRLDLSYRQTITAVRGKAFAAGARRWDFRAGERAALYRSIRDKLRRLPERFRIADPGVADPADLFGISHEMVKRHFRGGRNPDQLTTIRRAIGESSALSTEMGSNRKVLLVPLLENSPKLDVVPKSLIKGLGPGLSGVSGGLTVFDYYDRVETAKKVIPGSADIYAVSEGAKAAGGVLGGYVGGEVAAAAMVLALGTPVGWASVAVFGLAALGGSALGGWLGSEFGGRVAEDRLLKAAPTRADEIRMIVEGPDPLDRH